MRANFYAKTVEIPLSELPPPPNARAKLIDALSNASRWAPDVGDDIADAIATLIDKIDRRKRAA
jgi:hypothetical protein